MAADESYYRREEDRRWRESVEARLVSLISAQKATDDQFDRQAMRLDDLGELLEGDPLMRNDSGLKGDVAEAHRGLNELRAIMSPDALGKGGIKNRLDEVERELGLRVITSENRWKVLIAAIGATATITTALVMNLDQILPYFKKVFGREEAPLSQPIKRHGEKTNKKGVRGRQEVVHESPASSVP